MSDRLDSGESYGNCDICGKFTDCTYFSGEFNTVQFCSDCLKGIRDLMSSETVPDKRSAEDKE